MTSLLVSPSVSLVDNRPAVTSLQIAEHFGKRHDSVLRDIRRVAGDCPDDFGLHNFVETFRNVAGPNNSEREEVYFLIHRDGFMLLVMGYTGKKALQIKLAYIAAFNAMEAELAGNQPVTICHDFPETTTRLSCRTDPERKELTATINAWVSCAPIHYAGARHIVNSHFGVKSVDELTVAQVREAIALVQSKIDDTPKALPEAKSVQDANNDYRRMREDLEMVTRIMNKLCGDARVYLPQSGSFSRLQLLQRISASAGRVVNSLYEAREHLQEANSLTRMLQ